MTILLAPVISGIMTEPNILDRAKVAALLGFTVRTLGEYRRRFRGTDKAFPEPDGYFGNAPYWLETRTGELKAWAAARERPGRPRKQS